MKKLICFLLCFCLLYALPACSVEDPPTKEIYQDQEQQPPEIKSDTFGLNETAVFSDLKFTATEIKETHGDSFFAPEAGNVFVGVKFTVENISTERQSISSLLLFDAYVNDVKCGYSFNADCAFDSNTLDGDIAPGKKLVGWYAVEVPSNWHCLELDVLANWLSNDAARFVFTK